MHILAMSQLCGVLRASQGQAEGGVIIIPLVAHCCTLELPRRAPFFCRTSRCWESKMRKGARKPPILSLGMPAVCGDRRQVEWFSWPGGWQRQQR